MAKRELSDDELDLVSAAGTPEMMGLSEVNGDSKDDPWIK